MELDTEKLLPALQQHFEQEQEDGQDQDASHPHSQDENKMGGGDDKPGVRAQGAGNWRSSKEKGDSRFVLTHVLYILSYTTKWMAFSA